METDTDTCVCGASRFEEVMEKIMVIQETYSSDMCVFYRALLDVSILGTRYSDYLSLHISAEPTNQISVYDMEDFPSLEQILDCVPFIFHDEHRALGTILNCNIMQGCTIASIITVEEAVKDTVVKLAFYARESTTITYIDI